MIKLLTIVFIHILLLNFVQFIAWPENFLWPYLSQNGFGFYENIFALYPPVYYELLTGFTKVFGISFFSLQLFNYLIVILTDVLLWEVSKKKFLPLILFVPLQIFFEGHGSWPDQLLAPIFLAAYMSFQKKRWLLLGAFLALALFVKQTAIYFCVVLFLVSLNKQSFLKIVVGGLVVCVCFGIYFLVNQNFYSFFNNAIWYILTFHPTYELQRQIPTLSQGVISGILFIPAILIGLFKRKFLLISLLIASSLGVYSRFEYFHLQPALPFLATLLAMSPVGLLVWGLFMVTFLRFVMNSFGLPPRFGHQIVFPSMDKGEKTAFINTWDHYYYLSGTIPVGKTFVPSTPWTMDYAGNQEKIIQALRNDAPRLVFMHECFSAKGVCYKPEKVRDFVLKNYSKSGELSDGTGIFEYDPMSQ